MTAGELSKVTIVGGLIALACLALAGVLFVQPGPESLQRLGLFFGVIGTGVAALAALLKSEQTAKQTNGQLDDRIRRAVFTAMDSRRRGDPPTGIVPETGTDIGSTEAQPSPDPASAR